MHKMQWNSLFSMRMSKKSALATICLVIIVNSIAIFVTMYDKKIAEKNRGRKKKKRRISEFTLFCISALGGSVSMFITMIIIRHKTQKYKFMLGIPTIIAIQIVVIVLIAKLMILK